MNKFNIYNRECGCIYMGNHLKIFHCSDGEWGFWTIPNDQSSALTPASDTEAENAIKQLQQLSLWAHRGMSIASTLRVMLHQ